MKLKEKIMTLLAQPVASPIPPCTQMCLPATREYTAKNHWIEIYFSNWSTVVLTLATELKDLLWVVGLL